MSSSALFIAAGQVHAAASGLGLFVLFVVLLALFGGGKSGGNSKS